jgi:hypothetical protein
MINRIYEVPNDNFKSVKDYIMNNFNK